MSRLTKALDNNNSYIVDEASVQHGDGGYTGEAVDKLAKFENVYDGLVSKQKFLADELEKLKSEGKTNSVKFRQLLGDKMTGANILILFKTYGL